jgi:predicted Zn-dependent protease with MMP-like domain
MAMGRSILLCVAALGIGACKKTETSVVEAYPAPNKASAVASTTPAVTPVVAEREAPLTTSRPTVQPLPVCNPEGLDPLSAARRFYDEAQYEAALSCAAQASALAPDDPLAHSERGFALAALERFDEAKLAYARALALDPEHLDGLLGASRLYSMQLHSSRELDELGLIYAERGLQLAIDQGDAAVQTEFEVLAAMAFNDLGQSTDALERADAALSRNSHEPRARYERALALFELCRFDEAKVAFRALLKDPDRGAHAHHHLALLLERETKHAEAEAHFAQARRLAPEDFLAPQQVGADAFREKVERAVAALSEDMRKDLAGIPVTAEDLPLTEDLTGAEPPLSPTILGLFRGPSLGEPCPPEETPCRSVVLYRKNLSRAVQSEAELDEQIRVTLLHEIGHLRGEDDFELAARGLE